MAISELDRAERFGVDEVLSLPASIWDKRIAVDLVAEMEIHLADQVATLPEMRRVLAVRGYQRLRRRIERDVKDKTGIVALRAMAHSMRDFALQHPGLSAATFRTAAATDNPDWRRALGELLETAYRVLAQVELEGEPARQALRMLRSLIRGFVQNEMAASVLEPLEYARSFELAIDAFVLGLPAFHAAVDKTVTP
jgi:hypothetical protein